MTSSTVDGNVRSARYVSGQFGQKRNDPITSLGRLLIGRRLVDEPKSEEGSNQRLVIEPENRDLIVVNHRNKDVHPSANDLFDLHLEKLITPGS